MLADDRLPGDKEATIVSKYVSLYDLYLKLVFNRFNSRLSYDAFKEHIAKKCKVFEITNYIISEQPLEAGATKDCGEIVIDSSEDECPQKDYIALSSAMTLYTGKVVDEMFKIGVKRQYILRGK
jgi:hypothetical protein